MQQILEETTYYVIYIANIHFSHLPFRGLSPEVLVPTKCTSYFYGIVSHRCLWSMSLLIHHSETMTSEANHWEIMIRCYNSLGSFLESNPGTLVERVCQHPPAKQSDGFVKLSHSLILFAFLLSSQNWRIRCSPKRRARQSLYTALWILVFTSGGNLTSSLTAPYLKLWKSWKHATVFTSSSICMKKHQWWSVRGNHWDQSPAARAATLNLVAREQHVGCFLCKTGGKVEKCMWVAGVDSKTGGRVCDAECLALLGTGTAPSPRAKPVLQHRAHIWPMLRPGHQHWQCGLLFFKSAKGDEQETIINVTRFFSSWLYRNINKDVKTLRSTSNEAYKARQPGSLDVRPASELLKSEKKLNKTTYLFTPSCRQKRNPNIQDTYSSFCPFTHFTYI